MASKVKPIPDGFHSVTPYLSIKGAGSAVGFYKRAFGAEEIFRLELPDGRIGHAEIQIGDCRVMVADEMPENPDAIAVSPESLRGTTVAMHVYVTDVDARFARAVEAGAIVKRPVGNQFYGDRSGTVLDPFGHLWTLATRIEDVTPEEMTKRMAALPTG